MHFALNSRNRRVSAAQPQPNFFEIFYMNFDVRGGFYNVFGPFFLLFYMLSIYLVIFKCSYCFQTVKQFLHSSVER